MWFDAQALKARLPNRLVLPRNWYRIAARKSLPFILPMAAVAVLGTGVGIGVAARIYVPEVESITEYTPGLATQLYDGAGRTYHVYFRESRVLIEEGDVPRHLRNALLAAEDRRFFQHGGVDARGILRTVVQNAMQGRRAQGASTLTMQLAGTLYLDRTQRTWKRKTAEAFRAVQLEKILSKQQILTLYCNVINLGHGNYGFESAARFYFDKSVAELTLAENAALVAVVPRPSEWTPIKRPDLIRGRRNRILKVMAEERFISAEERDLAMAEPLRVARRRRELPVGPYFAEEVRRYLYANYGDQDLYEGGLQVRTTLDPGLQQAAETALREGLVRLDRELGWRGPTARIAPDAFDSYESASWSVLESAGGAEDGDAEDGGAEDRGPQAAGAPVGTWVEGLVLASSPRQATVKVADWELPLAAQDVSWTGRSAVSSVLKPGDVAWFELAAGEDPSQGVTSVKLVQAPELEGAVVLLESASGAVRALVGGWDFRRNEFNRAVQARRQVGSAFKPFVLGAAFEAGFTPADTLFDAPVVFTGADNRPSYSPRNFHRHYEGIITLREALEQSINVTAVKLLDLVGVENVIDFARRCGITSELPPFPSLALGSADLSVLELAAAYASLPNQGLYVEPYLVETVSSADGRVLESHRPRAVRAMEPDVAYLLTHTLRGVVERGTATSLRSLGIQVAGKTGTTDDYSDAWFAGFTPDYTLVVWVGHDRKRSIGPAMTGGRVALPIWQAILERGLDEGRIPRQAAFPVPSDVVLVPIEGQTGLRATAQAREVVLAAFKAGTEPVADYEPSRARVMELPWYQQRPFYGVPKEGENMPEDIEDWDLVLRSRD